MPNWSLTISNETDLALKSYLEQKGEKFDNLSRFVEEAVKGRLFELTVKRIKERNSVYDQNPILCVIDEAVDFSRENRS